MRLILRYFTVKISISGPQLGPPRLLYVVWIFGQVYPLVHGDYTDVARSTLQHINVGFTLWHGNNCMSPTLDILYHIHDKNFSRSHAELICTKDRLIPRTTFETWWRHTTTDFCRSSMHASTNFETEDWQIFSKCSPCTQLYVVRWGHFNIGLLMFIYFHTRNTHLQPLTSLSYYCFQVTWLCYVSVSHKCGYKFSRW